MNRKWKYAVGIAAVLSIALIIVPWVFPICEMMMQTANGGMTPMRCHYAYQAELLVSTAALITAVVLFLIRGAEGRRLGGLFISLQGIIAVLIVQDFIIGICTGHVASCHITRTWTVIIGSLLAVAGIVLAFIAPSTVREEGAQQSEEEEA
ncbi:MAG: DUF4418 family protein [Firmicutes bacterium]|nr:DUF4418 family protein [Bacillota bacterium]